MKKSIYDTVHDLLTRDETASYFWMLRRKAQSQNILIRYWARIRYRQLMLRGGSGIPFKTRIDSLPQFPHGVVGIFMSEGAHIGKDCTIFQQVTIGSNLLEGSKGYGCPSVGDHVLIGAGAKIIGGVHIGDHVRIGANCVVTQDIPDNATVVAGYPRIILHETAPDRKNSTVIPRAD